MNTNLYMMSTPFTVYSNVMYDLIILNTSYNSGYLGAHVAKECLENGYTVRGTVRSLSKKKGVEHVEHWQKEGLPITLVEADLLNEKSWEAACEGADYVIRKFQRNKHKGKSLNKTT